MAFQKKKFNHQEVLGNETLYFHKFSFFVLNIWVEN